MLYHKNCNGHITFDSAIRIKSEINITKDGVRLAGGRVTQADNELVLTCQCGKKMTAGDIVAPCMNCGEVLSLEDLFIPYETQGIYCKKNGCIDAVANGQRSYKASTLISKLAN